MIKSRVHYYVSAINMACQPDEWEKYFHSNEPPDNLEKVMLRVDAFVKQQCAVNRKLVLVTVSARLILVRLLVACVQ